MKKTHAIMRAAHVTEQKTPTLAGGMLRDVFQQPAFKQPCGAVFVAMLGGDQEKSSTFAEALTSRPLAMTLSMM